MKVGSRPCSYHVPHRPIDTAIRIGGVWIEIIVVFNTLKLCLQLLLELLQDVGVHANLLLRRPLVMLEQLTLQQIVLFYQSD